MSEIESRGVATPPQDEERLMWSGFFPRLTDERLAEFIQTHAERTARFPGGDSWQMTWLATNLQETRAALEQWQSVARFYQERAEGKL